MWWVFNSSWELYLSLKNIETIILCVEIFFNVNQRKVSCFLLSIRFFVTKELSLMSTLNICIFCSPCITPHNKIDRCFLWWKMYFLLFRLMATADTLWVVDFYLWVMEEMVPFFKTMKQIFWTFAIKRVCKFME